MSLADLRRIQACRDRSRWNREALPGVADAGGTGPEGFEQIVARYQAVYPDQQRRDWIEARLRTWKKGREE